MKRIACLLLSAAMIIPLFLMGGCDKTKTPAGSGGGGQSETAKDLNIYIVNAGYSTKWLDAIKEAFIKQDWVQEKYPGLKIDITTNAEFSYAESKIRAGKKSNEFDLFFSMSSALYGQLGSDRKPLLEDLTDVVNSQVPRESGTVGEKMLASALSSSKYVGKDGKEYYYSLPWVGGRNGILYNVDKLKKYGDVPLTTDQLVVLCDKITKAEGYAIIQSSSEAAYWEYLYPTFWAQYEGVDQYISFFEGKVNGKISRDIFKQQGRLESLKVMESVLSNKHLYESSNALSFMEAQTNFLMGKGVFMACGDWFDMEMSTVKEGLVKKGYKDTISMMRTPVVSSIVNKTPSIKALAKSKNITNDQALASVVKAIDDNQTGLDGVDAADFKLVAAARCVVHSIGTGHTSVIPSYVDEPTKELAKDLLRYMATDEANVIFAKNTNSMLPYKVNIEKVDKAAYDQLPAATKSLNSFFNNELYAPVLMPDINSFPLARFGGVMTLRANPQNQFEILFTQKTPKTARQLFDEDIKYWSDSTWQLALSNAGISE